MKKFLLLILFTFFFQTLLWADETIRTWTTNDGKKLSAIWDIEKYVGKDGDKEFIYFRSGGESYRTKFEDLVKSDRDYISGKHHTAKGFEKNPEEQLENESGKDSDESKGYALLIGVNEYKKPFQSLQFCESDMKYLAETFERIGFQKDKIVLLAGTGNSINSPTKEHIMKQVEGICRKAEPDDLLIIAFSGHGVTIGGVEYICPNDADLNDTQTLIRSDKIFDELTKSRALRKLMIVDACRNELTIPGKKGLEEYEKFQGEVQDRHDFVLLASCDSTQFSWESDDLKHGVFTHFLVKGLQGEAKDKEGGNVMLFGLVDYASQKSTDFVWQKMKQEQFPTVNGVTRNFVLAKLDSGKSSSQSSEYKPEHEPGERPEHEPGERMVKTVDGIEYAFRWCPKGSFTMGSNPSEWEQVERKSIYEFDEDQHQVKLTGFWMLETEVTQTMWKHIMGNEPSYFKGPQNSQNSQNPVEQVSWSKCEEFCQKLSAKVGGIVSLPTEAQWEYACRAGSKKAYAGNLAAMAWYGEDKYYGSTHQVGLKQPNAWGLYDMHGNVWEWCRDWYAGYRTAPQSNPNGPNNGEYRVNRGGSWASEPGACRSASRDSNIPEDESPSIGFRPVLILNEK